MKIFDYEDIQLIPNKCIVKSRSSVILQYNLESILLNAGSTSEYADDCR